MYYLNDKHPEYEYAIYTQVNNALPYITELKWVIKLDDLLKVAQDIEKKHNHYNQRFYIDNKFYNNKYSLDSGGTYYKILIRNVSDWQDFDDFKKRGNSDSIRVIDISKIFSKNMA